MGNLNSGLIAEDKIGQRFGNLVVVSRAKNRGCSVYWNCKCNCGKEIEVISGKLKNKKIKSCGCLYKGSNWKGYGEMPKNKFTEIKAGAAARGHSFEITIEDCWNLFLAQDKKCALSGQPLSLNSRNMTASLDRIDSKLGYAINNIQWVHKDVNYMKQKFDVFYFIEMCKLITSNKTFKKQLIDKLWDLKSMRIQRLYELEYLE